MSIWAAPARCRCRPAGEHRQPARVQPCPWRICGELVRDPGARSAVCGAFPAFADAPILLPTRTNASGAGGSTSGLKRTVAAADRRRVRGQCADGHLRSPGRWASFPPVDARSGDRRAAGRLPQPVGELEGVREQVFAISSERRIRHPGVEAILAASTRVKWRLLRRVK